MVVSCCITVASPIWQDRIYIYIWPVSWLQVLDWPQTLPWRILRIIKNDVGFSSNKQVFGNGNLITVEHISPIRRNGLPPQLSTTKTDGTASKVIADYANVIHMFYHNDPQLSSIQNYCQLSITDNHTYDPWVPTAFHNYRSEVSITIGWGNSK